MTALRQNQRATMRQALAPQMRQGLKMLEMDIGALRQELYRELAENPVVEDIGHSLDEHTTGEVERASEAMVSADAGDWPEDGYDAAEEFSRADADALERRRKFFESRTRPETLEEHLRAQIGAAFRRESDKAIALQLVGSMDDNGRFAGSIPDLVMVTGASEARLHAIRKTIMTLDPPGCCALSLSECLLAQLDRLGDSPYRDDVALLISSHLEDLARHDWAAIEKATGMSDERIEDCLDIIKTLEPRPSRAFASSSEADYVKAEVHAVFAQGRWLAETDERDEPEIHISKRYLAMLASPDVPKETKDYIKAKIAAVEEIRDAIRRRGETIRAVAQAIFDAQPGFFERGLPGLVPLTMQEVADRAGVHHTTVSRTVNGKYASTPHGTVELRAFFIAGVATADGSVVARTEVVARLKELIEGEDKAAPLSDDALAETLKSEGYSVARRTVAKYRTLLGLPSAQARREKSAARALP